jgi:hypothetical protein
MDTRTNRFDDKERQIILKVRLNRAESEALAQLTAAKGMGAAAVMRGLLHGAVLANK